MVIITFDVELCYGNTFITLCHLYIIVYMIIRTTIKHITFKLGPNATLIQLSPQKVKYRGQLRRWECKILYVK